MPSFTKLSPDDVREIRRIRAEKLMRQKDVASLFGVAQTTIHKIESRKKWKHIA